MLPQNMKNEIMSSIDNYPDYSKDEEKQLTKDIEREIGSSPIVTVCGVPFGEDEMQRKERAIQIKSIADEKKIEEIIGKVSSTLHEALKERR